MPLSTSSLGAQRQASHTLTDPIRPLVPAAPLKHGTVRPLLRFVRAIFFAIFDQAVPDEAFMGCINFATIVLPPTVTSIGAQAR